MEIEENISNNKQQYIDLYDPLQISKQWNQIHYFVWKQQSDLNHFFIYFPNPKSTLLNTTSSYQRNEYQQLINNLYTIFNQTQDPSLVQGKWGIFSLSFPNRNGLQCYEMYSFIKNSLKKQITPEKQIEYLKLHWQGAELQSEQQLSQFLDYMQHLEPLYKHFGQTNGNFSQLLDALNIQSSEFESIMIELESKSILIKQYIQDMDVYAQIHSEELLVDSSNFFQKLQNKERSDSKAIQLVSKLQTHNEQKAKVQCKEDYSHKSSVTKRSIRKIEGDQKFEDNSYNTFQPDNENTAQLFKGIAQEQHSKLKRLVKNAEQGNGHSEDENKPEFQFSPIKDNRQNVCEQPSQNQPKMFIGTDPIFDSAYESDPELYQFQHMLDELDNCEQGSSFLSQRSVKQFIVEDSISPFFQQDSSFQSVLEEKSLRDTWQQFRQKFAQKTEKSYRNPDKKKENTKTMEEEEKEHTYKVNEFPLKQSKDCSQTSMHYYYYQNPQNKQSSLVNKRETNLRKKTNKRVKSQKVKQQLIKRYFKVHNFKPQRKSRKSKNPAQNKNENSHQQKIIQTHSKNQPLTSGQSITKLKSTAKEQLFKDTIKDKLNSGFQFDQSQMAIEPYPYSILNYSQQEVSSRKRREIGGRVGRVEEQPENYFQEETSGEYNYTQQSQSQNQIQYRQSDQPSYSQLQLQQNQMQQPNSQQWQLLGNKNKRKSIKFYLKTLTKMKTFALREKNFKWTTAQTDLSQQFLHLQQQLSIEQSSFEQIIQFIQTIKTQLSGYVSNDFLKYLLRKVHRGIKSVEREYIMVPPQVGGKSLCELICEKFDVKKIIIKLSIMQSKTENEILSKLDFPESEILDAIQRVETLLRLVQQQAERCNEILLLDLFFQIVLKIAQKQEMGNQQQIGKLATNRQNLLKYALEKLLIQLVAHSMLNQSLEQNTNFQEQEQQQQQQQKENFLEKCASYISQIISLSQYISIQSNEPIKLEGYLLANLKDVTKQLINNSDAFKPIIEKATEKQMNIFLRKFNSVRSNYEYRNELERQIFFVKSMLHQDITQTDLTQEEAKLLDSSSDIIKQRISQVELEIIYLLDQFTRSLKLSTTSKTTKTAVQVPLNFQDSLQQEMISHLEQSTSNIELIQRMNNLVTLLDVQNITLEQCSKISKCFECIIKQINCPKLLERGQVDQLQQQRKDQLQIFSCKDFSERKEGQFKLQENFQPLPDTISLQFNENNLYLFIPYLLSQSIKCIDKKKSKSTMTKILSWFLKEQYQNINGSEYLSSSDALFFYQDCTILHILRQKLDCNDQAIQKLLASKTIQILREPETCSYQIIQIVIDLQISLIQQLTTNQELNISEVEHYLNSVDREMFYDTSVCDLLLSYVKNQVIICRITKNFLNFTSNVQAIDQCKFCIQKNFNELQNLLDQQPLLLLCFLHIIEKSQQTLDFYNSLKVDAKFTNQILKPVYQFLGAIINFDTDLESKINNLYKKTEQEISQNQTDKYEELMLQIMVQKYQLNEKLNKIYSQMMTFHQIKIEVILLDYFKQVCKRDIRSQVHPNNILSLSNIKCICKMIGQLLKRRSVFEAMQFFQEKIGIFDLVIGTIQADLYYHHSNHHDMEENFDQNQDFEIKKMKKSQKCELFLEILQNYFKDNQFDRGTSLSEDKFQYCLKFFNEYSFVWILYQIYQIDDIQEENTLVYNGFCSLAYKLKSEKQLNTFIFNYSQPNSVNSKGTKNEEEDRGFRFILKGIKSKKISLSLPNNLYYQFSRKLIDIVKKDLEELCSGNVSESTVYILNLIEKCIQLLNFFKKITLEEIFTGLFEQLFSNKQLFLTKYTQLNTFTLNQDSLILKLYLKHAINNILFDYSSLIRLIIKVEQVAKCNTLLPQLFQILISRELVDLELKFQSFLKSQKIFSTDYLILSAVQNSLFNEMISNQQCAQFQSLFTIIQGVQETFQSCKLFLQNLNDVEQKWNKSGKQQYIAILLQDVQNVLKTHFQLSNLEQQTLLQLNEKQQQSLRHNLGIYLLIAQRCVQITLLQGQILETVIKICISPALKLLLQNNQEMNSEKILFFRLLLIAYFSKTTKIDNRSEVQQHIFDDVFKFLLKELFKLLLQIDKLLIEKLMSEVHSELYKRILVEIQSQNKLQGSLPYLVEKQQNKIKAIAIWGQIIEKNLENSANFQDLLLLIKRSFQEKEKILFSIENKQSAEIEQLQKIIECIEIIQVDI